MHSDELKHKRTDYTKGNLTRDNVNKDPFKQFKEWFKEAIQRRVVEPASMVLSTCSKDGKPTSRIVLLKEYNNTGFVFYTNYHSLKGHQIKENPYVSLLLFWPELERQVRIEGQVEKTDGAISDQYFMTRPAGSNISAIVSPQSKVIPDRRFLETTFNGLSEKGDNMGRPDYWGGYNVIPAVFEFWQGRADRLHDRIRYRKEDGSWIIERLAP